MDLPCAGTTSRREEKKTFVMRNHLPNEGREIQELLTDLMRQYFCEANPQPLMDRFADDILWLGSGEAQTGEGRAAVTANFERARAQLVPTKMSQDVCQVRPLGAGHWLAQFTCLLEAYAAYRMFLNVHERCVAIFRRGQGAGRDWEITYLHTSIAYEKFREGEMFALSESMRNYRNLHASRQDILSNPARENLYHIIDRKFHTLPPALQEALVDASVYRSLTVEQVYDICRGTVSRQELEDCFASASFFPYDYKKGAYSFQPLLRVLLRNRFHGRTQEERKAVYQRAACWFLAHGEFVDALSSASRAQDDELTLQVVAAGGLACLRNFSVERVLTSLHRLSPDMRARHLGVCQLLILYVTLHRPMLASATEREFLTVSLPRDYKLQAVEWAAFWMLKGIAAVPDLKAMLPYFRRARGLSEASGVRLPRDYFEGVTRSVAGQLFLYYRGPGQLQDNVRDLCEIYDCCGIVLEGVDAASWKSVLLGEAAYMMGRFEPAFDLMGRLSLAGYRSDDQREQAAVALSILPRILLFEGRTQEFSAWIDYYRVLKNEMTNPVWKADLDIVADFIMALLELPSDKVTQTLEKYLKWSSYPALAPSWQSTRHRLVLKTGRYQTLNVTGPTPIPSGVSFSSQLNRMYDNIMYAVAQQALGQREQALDQLRVICDEALLDGAIMPIAEHAEFLAPLLADLGQDPAYAPLVDQVHQYQLVQAEHVQDVILTPREKKIVAAVEAGRTNKEIAQQIDLAEITVKKILSTIYKKYNVCKRSQLQAKLRNRHASEADLEP